MKKANKLINLILPLITIACILLLWSVMAFLVNSEYILPSISDTFSAFIGLFKNAKFYVAFLFTFLRTLVAFIVSFLVSSVCAFFSYRNKIVEGVVNTLISIFRALPTIAVVLLLLFWTDSQTAPVIVTMLVVLPTTYTQLKGAFYSIDASSVEASMVDGANKGQAFFKVELPQMAPVVYSAIGSGISLNFKLMVAAEVLSATVKSLGNMLNNAKFSYEISLMLAMVIFAVAFGIIIETIFNKISNKIGDSL